MVLEIVIAASPPVVIALNNKIVNESLTLRIREHFPRREEPILEVLDSLLAALEAREVVLTQEHHLDYYYYFLSILLQSQKALLHQLPILTEVL